jgi:hypothetical protein
MRLLEYLPTPILSRIRTHRELRLVRRFKSKMTTPIYHDYLQRCQRESGGLRISWPEAHRHAARFRDDGFTSFWTPELEALARSVRDAIRKEEESGGAPWDGLSHYPSFYIRFPQLRSLFEGQVGDFIRAANGSHFKIYYGVLLKSVFSGSDPEGSQLWHWDGGPGTCMNLMFYLQDVEPQDGAMECLPWKYTYSILRRHQLTREADNRIDAASRGQELSDHQRRAIRCNWLGEQVNQLYRERVQQPVGRAGLVLPFRNNLLHRGGHPKEPGRSRYVCIFHIYPSHQPAPLGRYDSIGLEKRGSYPADPAEDF